MIDLSSGLIADDPLNEADLEILRRSQTSPGRRQSEYDQAAAKVRVLTRVFTRYCGQGPNADLVRALATNASQLAERYEINTYARWTHFAAQWAYLTNGLRASAGSVGGDYHPRGLLRTTGKQSYATIEPDLGQDIVSFPAKLDQPLLAVESAFAEWRRLGLNEIADTDDLEAVTRVLDADLTDIDLRRAWLNRARGIWTDPAILNRPPHQERAAMAAARTTVALLRLASVSGAVVALLGGAATALGNLPILGETYGSDIRAHAALILAGCGAVVVLAAILAERRIRADYRRGLAAPAPSRRHQG